MTDRCNLRCRYCVPSSEFVSLSHGQILTYEEITRVVRLLASAGVSSVRLTGGEPLVRKGLAGLVRGLGQVPGIADLSLTTNGLLLASRAADLKAAGLSRVNVSVDSLRSDRFTWITDPKGIRPPGDLDEVLRGLSVSNHVGLRPVKVNVVLMRGFNDDEVEDFARLARDSDYEVRFIEFMPMGPGSFWSRDRIVPAAEVIARLERAFGALIPDPLGRGSGPAARYRVPGFAGRIGVITPISSHFCVSCNRIRITADGKVRTCLFSDDEIDLMPFLRGGGTDGQILDAIRAALREKPHGHEIGAKGILAACARTMNHIGG